MSAAVNVDTHVSAVESSNMQVEGLAPADTSSSGRPGEHADDASSGGQGGPSS
jgi:hypothetical protein